MNKPKISVVMPAYNSEQYIAEAIESILNQTFSDFEFIIINDGSTDGTADIVKSYNDKRIKFVDNSENRGIVAVLNQGLSMARGEYIARMDSDDISHKNRFEKQIAYMDSHMECGVLSTAYHMFGTKERVVVHPKYVGLLNLLEGCYVAHPAVMIRKSVLDKYDFRYLQEFKHAEDYELWSRMALVTEIHNLSDVLLEYRWHGANVSIEHATQQRNLTDKIRQNILNKLTDDPKKQRFILAYAHGKTKRGILLPKWFGRIFCLFIFNRTTRHNFRDKYIKD